MKTATVFCYQWTTSGRSQNANDRTVHLVIPISLETKPSEIHRDPLNLSIMISSVEKTQKNHPSLIG